MVIGVAGLFVPVVPGWVLIFFGLSFISPELAERLKRRFFHRLLKQQIVRLKSLEKVSVQSGFTTKHFPLFLKKTDDLLDPGNQTKLAESLGGQKFALLDQVHGDTVAVLENSGRLELNGFRHLPQTDGVLTDIRGLTLLVLTADCLPVFFCARRWVGLVHAGWRGTQKKIVQKAYRLIREKSACPDSEIHVILGPRIGAEHYEVGDEFQDFFRRRGKNAVLKSKRGKWIFDLAKENEIQLREAGAKEKNISDLRIDTFSESENFYSFRRERAAAGRMVSFITIAGA